MSQKLAYTVNEWLERSGDSRAAFYRAVNEGRLKVRKNGRKTLILAEDGAEYLNQLPVYQPRSAA
jgi:predicted site-specific integrase-resolvase